MSKTINKQPEWLEGIGQVKHKDVKSNAYLPNSPWQHRAMKKKGVSNGKFSAKSDVVSTKKTKKGRT